MDESTQARQAPVAGRRHGTRLAILLSPLAIAGAAVAATAAVLAPSSASATTTHAKTETVVHVLETSKFGKILVDNHGFALYTYDKDTKNHSEVSGSLLSFWPALLARAGEIPVGSHVAGLGTVMRSNGAHQVTYHGKPLYTFVKDTEPGEVSGQGVGGFAVATVNSSTTSTATTSSATGASGYATPTTTTSPSTGTTGSGSGTGGYGY